MADPIALPDDCPINAVFRQVETIIKADIHLDRVIKFWQTWRGKPNDKADFAEGMLPAIRLTPLFGVDAWYGPSGFAVPLIVDVQMEVETLDASEISKVWRAVRRAFYPKNDTGDVIRLDLQRRLRDAGAETGEVLFQIPPTWLSEEAYTAGRMVGNGKIKLAVLDTLNP